MNNLCVKRLALVYVKSYESVKKKISKNSFEKWKIFSIVMLLFFKNGILQNGRYFHASWIYGSVWHSNVKESALCITK